MSFPHKDSLKAQIQAYLTMRQKDWGLNLEEPSKSTKLDDKGKEKLSFCGELLVDINAAQDNVEDWLKIVDKLYAFETKERNSEGTLKAIGRSFASIFGAADSTLLSAEMACALRIEILSILEQEATFIAKVNPEQAKKSDESVKADSDAQSTAVETGEDSDTVVIGSSDKPALADSKADAAKKEVAPAYSISDTDRANSKAYFDKYVKVRDPQAKEATCFGDFAKMLEEGKLKIDNKLLGAAIAFKFPPPAPKADDAKADAKSEPVADVKSDASAAKSPAKPVTPKKATPEKAPVVSAPSQPAADAQPQPTVVTPAKPVEPIVADSPEKAPAASDVRNDVKAESVADAKTVVAPAPVSAQPVGGWLGGLIPGYRSAAPEPAPSAEPAASGVAPEAAASASSEAGDEAEATNTRLSPAPRKVTFASAYAAAHDKRHPKPSSRWRINTMKTAEEEMADHDGATPPSHTLRRGRKG